MKLFGALFGKKKKTRHVGQKSSTAPLRYPAATKPNSDAQSKSFSQKQPDAGRSALRLRESWAWEQGGFQRQACKDDNHDFAGPHPLTCRKCGLPLQWNDRQISKYMGSYFEDVSYQWTQFMDKNDIVSFSVSAGDRPVFEASCDFIHLHIRNCLNGSRDGWMRARYPAGYFEPRNLLLGKEDIQRLMDFIKNCDFFSWKTPAYCVENRNAPGAFVEKRFCCTFANGKKFACLNPDNAEFKHLVSLVREMAGNNAEKRDRTFVQRMLEDTEKKTKQIYWLISCSKSMEGKWMDILKQGIPIFHHVVSREMHNRRNANAKLLVNVICFSDGAAWVTDAPVPEEEYQWESLPIGEGNDVGAAFSLLAQRLTTLPEPKRKLFPVVILVLDGSPTDDYQSAWESVKSLPGVEKNVLTVVFALGNHVDEKLLHTFGKGCVFYLNKIEDFICEVDPMLFSF